MKQIIYYRERYLIVSKFKLEAMKHFDRLHVMKLHCTVGYEMKSFQVFRKNLLKGKDFFDKKSFYFVLYLIDDSTKSKVESSFITHH